MLVDQSRSNLYLDYDFLEADEVGVIALIQYAIAITEGQQRFRNCWNVLVCELDPKTLMIDWFQKPVSLLVIDLKTCADDRVTLLLVNDFRHSIRVYSRHSRVRILGWRCPPR